MTSTRVPAAVRTAALAIGVLSAALPALAADLASTYAHDAFPAPEARAITPPSSPCRQSTLTRKSRARHRTAPAGRRENGAGATPEAASTERSERHAVVFQPDDDPQFP